MANKVLILRWAGSAYDSLGGLLELMAQEFAAQGLAAEMFAADGADWPKRLIETLNQGSIAFALTMSGIGADMLVDGKPVWEVAKVPLFNWSCDHPCYFPTRHGIRTPYLLHGYVFPDHARYNIRHLKSNGIAFAAHLGIPRRTLFPAAPMPLANRNGRIVFAKSGADTNRIEDSWRAFGPDLRKIVFAAAEELFTRASADFLPALQQIAEPFGLFFDGRSRLAMMLICEIDSYIRYKRANLVMNTILRYPVDVFGSGWDQINWDGATARFYGPTSWRSMIERLPDYVGCLSTNPLVEDSVHDRVSFALAAGVVPISDANAFTRTNMKLLGQYGFDFTRDSVEQSVEAVLESPSEAVARANETWSNLATPFGMRRSARQIMQFVMLQGLNAPSGLTE